MRLVPRLRFPRLRARLSLPVAAGLLAACVSTPVQGTPKGEAADPGALRLVGVVTVEGDTVRFDRPRAGDPTGLDVRAPRVEGGAIVGTSYGRPASVPLDDVAVYLHQEEDVSRGALFVAGGIGIAAVVAMLAYVLSGGL